MPNASTTVHRTKIMPFTVINCTNANGDPLPAVTNLPFSASNSAIADLTGDPANNRRFLIQGKNQGSSQITVGSGANALVIDVTVAGPPSDQVNRVELGQFESEQ